MTSVVMLSETLQLAPLVNIFREIAMKYKHFKQALLFKVGSYFQIREIKREHPA